MQENIWFVRNKVFKGQILVLLLSCPLLPTPGKEMLCPRPSAPLGFALLVGSIKSIQIMRTASAQWSSATAVPASSLAPAA